MELNHELEKLRKRIVELETHMTENKLAEDVLSKSEKMYHTFFEKSRDAICFVTTAGNYVVMNQSYLNLFGYTREELLKINVIKVYANSEDREKFHKKVGGKGFLDNYEGTYRKKDGTLIVCESTAAVSTDDNGKIMGYWGIIRDITERKKNEKRIRNYQIKLRNLSSNITLTEEKERRRIASNLHDLICQNLAFSKTKLVQIQKSLPNTRFGKNLKDIIDLIEQTNKDVHSLVFELSPPILYELGFVPAVEWLLEQNNEKHGICTYFNDDGRPKHLGDDVRVLLFQSVRELLTNVIKHAHAKIVKVSITKCEKKIKIEVKDDGIGFDTPPKLSSFMIKNGGFGLFNIHDRLDNLGGYFEVKSKPDCGTTVILVAPLKINN